MESSAAKESILKNVRKALTQKVPQPFPEIDRMDFALKGQKQIWPFYSQKNSQACWANFLFVNMKRIWLNSCKR